MWKIVSKFVWNRFVLIIKSYVRIYPQLKLEIDFHGTIFKPFAVIVQVSVFVHIVFFFSSYSWTNGESRVVLYTNVKLKLLKSYWLCWMHHACMYHTVRRHYVTLYCGKYPSYDLTGVTAAVTIAEVCGCKWLRQF